MQAKGYAEGAGDSLAGGLKKNVAKVTGNDKKEAEGIVVCRRFECSHILFVVQLLIFKLLLCTCTVSL